MVLILGRRVSREEQALVPAIKRKVFEVDSKNLDDSFDFSSGPSHAESVLRVFDEFRTNRLFTDVVIGVQGREFPCHRAMLSACSGYFQAMFCNDHRESQQMLVEISGVQAEAMEVLLQYVYTGRATITTQNVQYLFETANLFQISVLRDACAKFLEDQLDPCNCLGMQSFADTHSLKQLAGRCRVYALQNFTEVAQHEEFLHLQKEELQEYLANDELCVSREEVVFEAVMRWVYHNVEPRRPMLKELLQHIRLPLLHPNYFVQTVSKRDERYTLPMIQFTVFIITYVFSPTKYINSPWLQFRSFLCGVLHVLTTFAWVDPVYLHNPTKYLREVHLQKLHIKMTQTTRGSTTSIRTMYCTHL